MTALDKLKQMLVYMVTGERLGRAESVRARYEALAEESPDGLNDAMDELRGGTDETGLEPDSSRYYESRAVAAQMLDGSWVGWTYFYGGGKYGQPETLPWIEHAYDVTCAEVTKVVKEFKRAE